MTVIAAVRKDAMAWLRQVRKTGNPTISAQIVYGIEDKREARKKANQLMRELKVPLTEAMEYVGLDTRRDLADLKRLRRAKKKHYSSDPQTGQIVDSREDDDNAIQLQTLKLCLQLKGTLERKRSGEGDLAGLVVNIINQQARQYPAAGPASESGFCDAQDGEIVPEGEESASPVPKESESPILPKETALNGHLEQSGPTLEPSKRSGVRVH